MCNCGSGDLVWQAILILDELSHGLEADSIFDTSRLLIPDEDGTFRPAHQVCYNDSNDLEFSFGHEVVHICHPGVSKSTARKLNLRFLSALKLELEEDDDDDYDMAEDLPTRIHGVLEDYGIESSMNEFLANAADAGAERFAIVLDERSFDVHYNKAISPEMLQWNHNPSLILYNSAVFKPDDFKGLCKIGLGGKTRQSDSIGRYGLGALSMFHFSDVSDLIVCQFIV